MSSGAIGHPGPDIHHQLAVEIGGHLQTDFPSFTDQPLEHCLDPPCTSMPPLICPERVC
ncbi:hypothetical protein [Streptomyces sporangiiformans]|uniref:hypothetical protein n=1 Tax=Streptomyces sporangiiformans TaxID=2315329 RepID=UPI001F08DCC6|nr:hypothetical protein [Streptomyces sporangiiformans]